MSVRWYSLVVDCRDMAAQARWWAQALGWQVVYEDDDEVDIAPADGREPTLTFGSVPEGKQLKNRLHLDLAPGPDDDQAAEVERLIAHGASRADVGQGEQTWVVLADPEGNEFCVLSARE